jgi:hypothetical protein
VKVPKFEALKQGQQIGYKCGVGSEKQLTSDAKPVGNLVGIHCPNTTCEAISIFMWLVIVPKFFCLTEACTHKNSNPLPL